MAGNDRTGSGATRSPFRTLVGHVTGMRISAPRLLAGLMALAALFLAGWILLVDDPHGGEPVAVVVLDRPSGPQSDGGEPLGIRPTVDTRQAEPLPGGHTLPPADIVISDPTAGSAAPAASASVSSPQSFSEDGRYGPLPVISTDGTRPSERFARTIPDLADRIPRIAILIGGMGLSTTATEAAIDSLPPTITLVFAPYGREIDRLTDRARQAGHELMLQLPLEPYDYPDNDPGPHTLLTGLSDDQNLDRLHWVMSRMTGYVGAMNYMGARFSASDEALRPILGELRDRGLIYVDDGAAPRSLSGAISEAIGLPFAQADIVVDTVVARDDIRAQLLRLEQIARDRGRAMGVASGLPVTIDMLAAWSKELQARGIALVPATAIIRSGES